jgi:6-phosphogluconolactonase
MKPWQKEWLLIGTYTEPILFGTGEVVQGKGKGIHLYSFDDETGRFTGEGVFEGIQNPSYLCLSRDKRFLYAVNELKDFDGEASGGASAFAVEWEEDKPSLHFLNQQRTHGTDPCHINIDRQARCVYAANYSSGSVTVFQVMGNGSLSSASDCVQHEGRGKDPGRQAGPHAHAVVLTPDQNLLLAPDLGMDKLMVYKPDKATGKLHVPEKAYVSAEPGDGPRYCEFHPNGRFCYVINELSSSVSLLHYRAGSRSFSLEQKVSTLPTDDTGPNFCADLHITPDGCYLYASNRGHDSITAFAIDPHTGELEWRACFSCGGRTPRNFALSLSGRYLLVANQDSDNLVSFRIDYATGAAVKAHEIAAPMPVCVKPVKFPKDTSRRSWHAPRVLRFHKINSKSTLGV